MENILILILFHQKICHKTNFLKLSSWIFDMKNGQQKRNELDVRKIWQKWPKVQLHAKKWQSFQKRTDQKLIWSNFEPWIQNCPRNKMSFFSWCHSSFFSQNKKYKKVSFSRSDFGSSLVLDFFKEFITKLAQKIKGQTKIIQKFELFFGWVAKQQIKIFFE